MVKSAGIMPILADQGGTNICSMLVFPDFIIFQIDKTSFWSKLPHFGSMAHYRIHVDHFGVKRGFCAQE